MTVGGTSISNSAPPSMHAIGGSLGGALALSLLYPLERARVEFQTATGSTSDDESNDRNKMNVDLLSQERLPSEQGDRGGAAVAVKQKTSKKQKDDVDPDNVIQGSRSEESWQSCPGDYLGSSNLVSSFSNNRKGKDQTLSEQRNTSKSNNLEQKMGLLMCLIQLHKRGVLYQGAAPVVTTLAVSNFVFFYMHSFFKQMLMPSGGAGQAKTLRWSLLASTLAGIINVLMTNPLWVANLRIVTATTTSSDSNDSNTSHLTAASADQPQSNKKQKQKRKANLWKEMQHIVETEGWSHLWNGTWASLLLVSNPVIQFFAYEQLKNALLQLRRNKQGNLKPLEAFLLGALAKAISTVLTYPLQLAQTVMRVQTQEQEQQNGDHTTTTTNENHIGTHYKGTLGCLIRIYRHKGLEGWFAGMQTKLLQTVLTAAFTFLTYEQIIKALMDVHRALTLHNIGHGRGSNTPVP